MPSNHPAITEARRKVSAELEAICAHISVHRKVKLPLRPSEIPGEAFSGNRLSSGENKPSDDDQTRFPRDVQAEAERQQSEKKRLGLAGRALKWIKGLFAR